MKADLNYMANEIRDIQYKISRSKGIKKSVLSNILLKKLIRFKRVKKERETQLAIDRALRDLINEQKEQMKKEKEKEEKEEDGDDDDDDDDKAYESILEDNEKEMKEKRNKQYRDKVKADWGNNRLMERVNSERIFRSDKSKRELSKPYTTNDSDSDNDNYDDYVPIKKFEKDSIPTFSSKRLWDIKTKR